MVELSARDVEPLPGWMSLLRPELWLVVESVRRSCGAPPAALRPIADWDEVVRQTAEHHMFPAVDACLRCAPMDIPLTIRRLIETGATLAILDRQHRQEPGIRLALETLVQAGCTPVVLKGVALGYNLHQRPEHRLFSDVDLLLPEQQLDVARAALLDAAFEPREDQQLTPGHQHLPGLFSPRRGILVELHRALFDAAAPFRLDMRDVLARAHPTTILGIPVRVLAPEDTLIHVCVHLSYSHRYRRYPLRSLADVLVLARSGLVDWHEVVRRTRQASADGAVYWPLVLARVWLGAPVPDVVLQALAPHRALRRLIDAVMRTGYVLDRIQRADDRAHVLFDLLLNMSLYTGCSARLQLAGVLRSVFPSRDDVTHISPRMRASRLEYALALLHVGRVWRGAAALWRLVSATRSSQ